MAEESRPLGHPAGIGIRLFSACYDLILLFSITFIVVGGSTTIVKELIGPLPHWVQYLLFTTVCYAYFVGFWFKAGATTGMRPWRLKVAMAASGDPVGLAAATARFLGLMLTWLALGLTLSYMYAVNAKNQAILEMLTGALSAKMVLPIFTLISALPAISLACMLFTRRNQALHDLLSGTTVFRISKS